ncbi:hypothetical protein SAMN05216389_1114 [Oceanobacillus limi]|uniref:Uncharacterized protein n=1 Tax=Oceanobacillus limi TaxID=930131 RepID=A0A1I0EAF6_9BACI|nr:hypothetical protein [Oceanobacillus limi]SET42025.1 hypothetical protein SAMN05216389_1114 [Oceanobacillus limi]
MTEQERKYIAPFAELYGYSKGEVAEYGDIIARTLTFKRYVLAESIRELFNGIIRR